MSFNQIAEKTERISAMYTPYILKSIFSYDLMKYYDARSYRLTLQSISPVRLVLSPSMSSIRYTVCDYLQFKHVIKYDGYIEGGGGGTSVFCIKASSFFTVRIRLC